VEKHEFLVVYTHQVFVSLHQRLGHLLRRLLCHVLHKLFNTYRCSGNMAVMQFTDAQKCPPTLRLWLFNGWVWAATLLGLATSSSPQNPQAPSHPLPIPPGRNKCCSVMLLLLVGLSLSLSLFWLLWPCNFLNRAHF